MSCILTSIWLGLLIAFLLGLLLGWWIWGCCRKKKSTHVETRDVSTASLAPKAAPAPKATVLPAGIKLNDLKIVEGIGPKIAQILNDNGINSWVELADASPEKIKEFLTEAGPRFQMANPGSWPKQARMAADGEWEALKKWQDEHDHGRE